MAANSEFYKGKKKRKSYAFIPVGILVALFAVAVVFFYGLQKYAVISKEDVSVHFTLDSGEEEAEVDVMGNEIPVFEDVSVNINFETPDYSAVAQTVDGKVPELRAIYVSSDELYRDQIMAYAGRLSRGNALVFEMKPRGGFLNWNSNAEEVQKYGMYSMNTNVDDIAAIIKELKSSGVYMVAQISCCLDELYANRCSTVALTSEYGSYYRENGGIWLDAYNVNLRKYVVDMVKELYDMGFDEVVLADVAHPKLEEDQTVQYTRDMSTTQSPVNAVCGFVTSITEDLKDRKGYLSIYLDTPVSLVKADTSTGQDGRLFLKLFDRVYYRTDRYIYSFNLGDIESSVTVGNAGDRFVPVVENYLPDSTSWVFIITDEDA